MKCINDKNKAIVIKDGNTLCDRCLKRITRSEKLKLEWIKKYIKQ